MLSTLFLSLSLFSHAQRRRMQCFALKIYLLLICRRQEHTERKTIEIQTQQCLYAWSVRNCQPAYTTHCRRTFSHSPNVIHLKTLRLCVCKSVCDKGIKYRFAIKHIHRKHTPAPIVVQMTEFTWLARCFSKITIMQYGQIVLLICAGSIDSICDFYAAVLLVSLSLSRPITHTVSSPRFTCSHRPTPVTIIIIYAPNRMRISTIILPHYD